MSQPSDRDVAPRRPGRFARPYALTGGRTRPAGSELPLESLVTATSARVPAAHGLTSEQRQIMRLCTRAMSIAEISARLNTPLGVARVLVSDMHAEQLVEVRQPATADGDGDLKDLLERVLDGLRTL
jgi:hypothetical protein